MKDIIDKYSRLPFRYGQDCCQFVGECVEAQTGFNPMAKFSYQSEDEAYAIIDSYGDLEDAITATLGEPKGDYNNGDVCVMELNGRQICGIMYRDRIIARTPSGVMDYPPEWAKCFWGV